MKNRLVAVFICLIMLFCCACGNTSVKKTSRDEAKKQFVLSMNPGVITMNGEVSTASKAISSNMAADIKLKSGATLYDNIDWQWAYETGENEYKQRAVRSLEAFKDSKGKTAKGVPYAYTMTDDKTTSLTVYNKSQLDISEYNKGDLADSGLLFSFSGSEKEALIYKATSDVTLSLADASKGKISLVKGISSINTDAITSEKPCGVMVQVYVNNCLFWQEILGNAALLGNTISAVDFPEISDIVLSKGDMFIIAVKAITEAKGIERGTTDVPDYYSEIKKPVRVGREIEIAKEETPTDIINTVPLLKADGESAFSIIRADSLDEKTTEKVEAFQNDLGEALDTTVLNTTEKFISNFAHCIIVGDTALAESKAIISEIDANRSNNLVDYIIRMSGENVFIGAKTADGYKLAFDYFVNTYCKGKDKAIPKVINYISAKESGVRMKRIAGNAISAYRIVLPKNPSYIETLAAKDLAFGILFSAGVNIDIVRDTEPSAANEIILGNTSRTDDDVLVTASSKENSGFGYKINVKDGKLYISGSATAISAGCIDFSSILKRSDVFSNGYSYSGSYDGKYSLANGFKLMVADEFNGTKLSEIWRLSPSELESESGIWSKISDECAWVENGNLVQKVYTDGKNRYGSRLSTDGALNWKYGYCEIRVKYVTTKNICLGFCCYGCNSPESGRNVEYDIVESFDSTNAIKHTFHTWNKGHELVAEKWVPSYINGTSKTQLFGNEYHTIGFEWDTEAVTTYVDGHETLNIPITDPKYECFDYPCFVELTTQFFQQLNLQPDASFLNDYTRVDYFRLYQKADNNSAITKTGIY